jgi:hypothetical protein
MKIHTILLALIIFSEATRAQSSIATEMDSAAIYDQTLAVINYYESHGYTKTGTSFAYGSGLEKLDYAYEKFKNKSDSTLTEYGMQKVPLSAYRRQAGYYTFYQRETKDRKLDIGAPMMLYDRRIPPRACYRYKNMDEKNILYGDIVTVVSYDPLLIKPHGKMTDEDEELRDKRYHEIDSMEANCFSVCYPTTNFITQPYDSIYDSKNPNVENNKSIKPYVVRIYYTKLGQYKYEQHLDPITLWPIDDTAEE